MSTTGCLPRYCSRVTMLPSAAGSENVGAIEPTRTPRSAFGSAMCAPPRIDSARLFANVALIVDVKGRTHAMGRVLSAHPRPLSHRALRNLTGEASTKAHRIHVASEREPRLILVGPEIVSCSVAIHDGCRACTVEASRICDQQALRTRLVQGSTRT